MKYAHYDNTNGKLLGWYDSEIHEIIPTPNIEVTNEDWQIAIDNNYNFVNITTNTLSFKDFRTFDDLKKQKVNEIKQAFTEELSQGYACDNGIKMDCNLSDIQAFKAGYDLANQLGSATMDVTDYFNMNHEGIALDTVTTMITELGLNYNSLRVKKNTLRAQAEQATNQEELDIIQW